MIYSAIINFKYLQTISLFPRLRMSWEFLYKITTYFILVLLLIRYPIEHMLDYLFLVVLFVLITILLFAFPYEKLEVKNESNNNAYL